MGPQLFSLYTAELADLASKYGVTLHAYADDNQLYVHCSISEAEQLAAKLAQCVTAIQHWMAANRLKLNPDKTELMWTGTRHSMDTLADGGPALTYGIQSLFALQVPYVYSA